MLLRPAQPDDAMAVARVHVRSWQVAYRTLMPQRYLDQLRPEDRAAHYDFVTGDPQKPHTIVAVESESVLGFATTMPARVEDLNGYGELAALYVDPEHWGRGIGLALVQAARAHLVEAGFLKAMLWVLVGNTRADRFYQKDKWLPDGTRRADTIWGVQVDELRYIRELQVPRPALTCSPDSRKLKDCEGCGSKCILNRIIFP
jgi:GNAT superfamily N-acetyltransferase